MSGVDAHFPLPGRADGPAEFVALLQQLKERSGCTYRQLEERAVSAGDVLPRSTIADALRRQSVPRPEVVAAFVRACGAGPEEVETWLTARDRIASASPTPSTPSAPVEPPSPAASEPLPPATSESPQPAPTGPPQPDSAAPGTRSTWLRQLVVLLTTFAVLAAVAGGAWLLSQARPGGPWSSDGGTTFPPDDPRPTASTARPELSGWVRIRVADRPDRCVSEGREHTGQYPAAVAVQRACAGAEPPQTLLQRVGGEHYFIKWVHPVEGTGCLTVLTGGSVVGDMLEPWDDCREDRAAQLFRIEPVDLPVAGGYRLRPAYTDLCLGFPDGGPGSGAELLREPCTGAAEQEFLIELISPTAVPGPTG
ncbi:helix-turn-helix domain-containing protein [Micromonospora sp. NPDC049523]|uniref:helix-turn-helix domain-containing protein n=1 Tax=Micromonospora sp. NPDC049523 TaxID=3155921 RepID=UPI003422788D